MHSRLESVQHAVVLREPTHPPEHSCRRHSKYYCKSLLKVGGSPKKATVSCACASPIALNNDDVSFSPFCLSPFVFIRDPKLTDMILGFYYAFLFFFFCKFDGGKKR